MAKTKYTKKNKNGKEYYFFRLRHPLLKAPRDLYAKTTKELDKKIKILTEELDNDVMSDNSLFLPVFENWLFDIHFVNKKFSTTQSYYNQFQNHIATHFKKVKLKELNLHLIQNFYNTLYRNGVGIPTIKQCHKMIKPFIRYMFANNKITKEFSTSLILPKPPVNITKEETDINPFTLIEQIQFLNSIKGNKLEALYICALDTGMRQGEILALTWDDINFKDNIISVNKTTIRGSDLTRNGYDPVKIHVATPKTQKSIRYIPMTKQLRISLINHKNIQDNLKPINKAKYSDFLDTNIVFQTRLGSYFFGTNIRKKFVKELERANLRHIRFHDLRHTFATRLFEAGENVKIIQELLGHSSISITLDTYTHILDKLKKETSNKLDTMYSNFNLY